jgi:hypothetical protein
LPYHNGGCLSERCHWYLRKIPTVILKELQRLQRQILWDCRGNYVESKRFQRIHEDSMVGVYNPTASTDGEWMELVESEQSLSAFSGDSENPIHYESSKNQIATNPLRENVKDPVRLYESS